MGFYHQKHLAFHKDVCKCWRIRLLKVWSDNKNVIQQIPGDLQGNEILHFSSTKRDFITKYISLTQRLLHMLNLSWAIGIYHVILTNYTLDSFDQMKRISQVLINTNEYNCDCDPSSFDI